MLNSCLLIYELLWRETKNNSDANNKTAGLQRSLSFCFVLFCFCFLSTKSCSLCLFTCLVLNIGSSVQIGCQKSRKFNTMFCKYNINVLPKWNGNLVLSYLFFSRSLCWFKNLFTPQKKQIWDHYIKTSPRRLLKTSRSLHQLFFKCKCKLL